MRWKFPALIAAAAVIATALALPAEAASRKRVVVYRSAPPPTVFVSRDENGRTRTRLIVQQRSYLDGGTEVMPGERKFTDYAIPPYFSPIDILGPGQNYDRRPLNSRSELGAPRMW